MDDVSKDDDVIYRQAAIDAAMRDVSCIRTHEFNAGATRAANRIKQLPPAQPEKQRGYWIIDERPESDREVICSICEQPVFKYHKLDFDYRPRYCPNCGKEMRADGGDDVRHDSMAREARAILGG